MHQEQDEKWTKWAMEVAKHKAKNSGKDEVAGATPLPDKFA
jgi:hypothetical protein